LTAFVNKFIVERIIYLVDKRRVSSQTGRYKARLNFPLRRFPARHYLFWYNIYYICILIEYY